MMDNNTDTKRIEKEKMVKEMRELGIRISDIRRKLRLKQDEFCAKLAIASSTLSMIETGKITPNVGLVFQLYKNYSVNLEYLFKGSGNMFRENAFGGGSDREDIADIERFEDFVWLLKNSPKFKHAVLSIGTNYFYDNEASILKNVSDYLGRQK